MGAAATHPSRGRPRSEACDQAILEATLRLLSSEGYARMSMDAVAAEAGVSKPTIYLRYRSKADLATAALARMREVAAPNHTGDLRRDLVAELRQARRNADRVAGLALVGTCLMEERHTPELLQLFRERTVSPRRRVLRELLERSRERGEIPEDADLDTAVVLLAGAYYAQHLTGERFPSRWEERVVDSALRGVGFG